MKPEIESLIGALARTREFLVEHGEQNASGRLGALAKRLDHGDLDALVSAVSEATGGMGSLNDFVFGNARLDASLQTLVREVERCARQAASVSDVSLGR